MRKNTSANVYCSINKQICDNLVVTSVVEKFIISIMIGALLRRSDKRSNVSSCGEIWINETFDPYVFQLHGHTYGHTYRVISRSTNEIKIARFRCLSFICPFPARLWGQWAHVYWTNRSHVAVRIRPVIDQWSGWLQNVESKKRRTRAATAFWRDKFFD